MVDNEYEFMKGVETDGIDLTHTRGHVPIKFVKEGRDEITFIHRPTRGYVQLKFVKRGTDEINLKHTLGYTHSSL